MQRTSAVVNYPSPLLAALKAKQQREALHQSKAPTGSKAKRDTTGKAAGYFGAKAEGGFRASNGDDDDDDGDADDGTPMTSTRSAIHTAPQTPREQTQREIDARLLTPADAAQAQQIQLRISQARAEEQQRQQELATAAEQGAIQEQIRLASFIDQLGQRIQRLQQDLLQSRHENAVYRNMIASRLPRRSQVVGRHPRTDLEELSEEEAAYLRRHQPRPRVEFAQPQQGQGLYITTTGLPPLTPSTSQILQEAVEEEEDEEDEDADMPALLPPGSAAGRFSANNVGHTGFLDDMFGGNGLKTSLTRSALGSILG